MWSFGCILVELVTGRPLFPAIDEKELLELFIVRIGMPPEEMINKCSKRKFFFDHNRRLTRSKRSRVPKGSREGSDPIRSAIFSEDDDDFIDFVEVSSVKVVNLLSLLVSSYLSCFTLLLYNRLFVCFRRNA